MLTVKPDGSVEIKYKDVVQALTELRNYITREKMNTCYVLGITLQTMRDWWDKSFNEVFNDKVMVDIRHQNLPKDELEKHLREIASYVRKSKYPDIIRESVLCLEKLGEDKDRLLQKPSLIDKITGRFLIDENTFKKIEELKSAEIEFRKTALNMKKEIKDKAILLNDPTLLSPNDIDDAKEVMNNERLKILDSISYIRERIHCPGLTIKLLSQDG